MKDQSEEDLIQNVVAEYIFFLMRLGNVPQSSLDDLEQDLTEETVEMYRKKTYGSFNLQHYRSKRNPSGRN